MSFLTSPNSSLTVRTSWLVAAKTMALAFTIAIPLLLVRRMPQHDFGLYKQIFLVVGTAVDLLPLGFGLTAYYFLPRDEHHRHHTVLNVVVFTTAVATLFATVLSLFPSLLILVFSEPAAARFAPWVGTIIVLWVLGSFLEIVTIAEQDFKVATFAILAIQATRAAFFLMAAIFSGTVGALVFAAVAQGLVQVGALMAYLCTRFPGFWRAFDRSFFRHQFAYAIPFGIAGTLWTLQSDLHSYFVSHQFGAAAYAVYAIGCFQLPFVGIVGDSVGSVMIPRISLFQHEQRTREILLLTARVMRKLAAVHFPAYAFLLVMRREFIVGLFTDRYLASIPVFAVNLTLIPLAILLVDPIMRAYAEHRHFLVKLHGLLFAGLTVALYFSVKRFGLVGAITLMVVSNCAGRIVTVARVVRILKVEPRDIALFTDVGKIGVAAAAAGLLTAIARTLVAGAPPLVALAVCGVWFSIVYAAAILASRVITPDEWRLVQSVLPPGSGHSSGRMKVATSIQD